MQRLSVRTSADGTAKFNDLFVKFHDDSIVDADNSSEDDVKMNTTDADNSASDDGTATSTQ